MNSMKRISSFRLLALTISVFASICVLGASRVAAQCETLQWSFLQSPPTQLTPRSTAMVFDTSQSRVFLFGGQGQGGIELGDTWVYQSAAWTPLSTAVHPSARHGGGMVYDSRRGHVLLFGGFDGSRRNDLWRWNGSAWQLLSPTGTPPSPRDAFAMVYDQFRDRVVVFGGVVSNTPGNEFSRETFEYNPQTNQWVDRTSAFGPSHRAYASAAYDPVRRITVLFGGGGDRQFSDLRQDTWSWDGSSWSQIASSGPSPRRLFAMAYNGARGRVTLFGGFSDGNPGTYHSDTWELVWNLSGIATWQQASISGPSPRSVAAMSFDPQSARVVLFGGGSASGVFGDFWSLTGPLLVQDQTIQTDICPSGTARFVVQPAGTGQFQFVWEYSTSNGWLSATDGSNPDLGFVSGASTAEINVSDRKSVV